MAKKTKEAEDERELREVFRVFDKNSRGGDRCKTLINKDFHFFIDVNIHRSQI